MLARRFLQWARKQGIVCYSWEDIVDSTWKTCIWQQYGAAIDMLEDTIVLCPDHLWSIALWKDSNDVRYGQFCLSPITRCSGSTSS